MTSVLGAYTSFWHWRPEDEEYLRRLDPAWVRIHQPTARAIDLVQKAAPNAKIMLRSWDIDDSNGERKRELYADPKSAAHRHIDLWAQKITELIREMNANGWSADIARWYMGLVNEPDPANVAQVVEYTREAMIIAQGRDWRLGVVCSSVGTFSKPSENDHGWTRFVPLEKPINDGGHILIGHEYWQPEGPRFGEDAGNLSWRHQHIPLDVPILIGEAGANGYIYGRHSQNDDAGWQKFMQPDQFAAQVKEYIAGCDSRVQGVCLYMLDFHSDQWWSFDTQPAMRQLLAIKDTKPSKRHTTHLPIIGNGPTPVEPEAHIPEQPDNTWTRSLAYVRRWEGGWADHPADPGGATNKGITIGTFIRWRTTHGQPTPTKDDLRAISDAEVNQIYFEWYWLASGADKLPWPLCLAHFDTAVNAGPGRADEMLTKSGGNFLSYMGHLMIWYTQIPGFETFGRAWIRRRAEILLEAAA